MNPLVSVVIPVYKTEKYVIKSVNSILSQTYKNLEVILVDDGSPDACPVICDELRKTDDRISVIHKENGGLSSARNAGIDKANGEYILFLDSDDTLADYAIEDMTEKAIAQGCDAVILAVAHEQFKSLTMNDFEKMFKQSENKNVLVDIKGLLSRKEYENAGYIYWRL